MSSSLTAEERAAIASYQGPVRECEPGRPVEPEWRTCLSSAPKGRALPAQGMIHPAFDGLADG